MDVFFWKTVRMRFSVFIEFTILHRDNIFFFVTHGNNVMHFKLKVLDFCTCYTSKLTLLNIPGRERRSFFKMHDNVNLQQ